MNYGSQPVIFHLLLESVLPEYDQYLMIYMFATVIAISTSKKLREVVLPTIVQLFNCSIQNIVRICKQITILILH
jgi:hypothetical protein